LWRQTQYDVIDKNNNVSFNNVSFEDLDIQYH
jgi:hypothetical protein